MPWLQHGRKDLTLLPRTTQIFVPVQLMLVSFEFTSSLVFKLTIPQAWVIIPIPKTAVKSVVTPYSLLPVPTGDASLFPSGFPADAHPVLVSFGYNNDIRMSALQIQSLMEANIIVPYVDRLGDGKTPFQSAVRNWIGGTNGQDIMGLVPGKPLQSIDSIILRTDHPITAIVGSFEGTTITVAQFVPNNAANQPIGPNEYIAQVKQTIVPNPVSGPGVIVEAMDMDFTITTTPAYTSHTFHTLINQVQTLTNGMCQRNPYYFNETFSRPTFTNGKVILYQPAGPAVLAGTYTGLTGYSANAETIGYNAQDCKTAAAMVDPAALA